MTWARGTSVFLILLRALMLLVFGLYFLNQYLNRLHEPAIPLSMLIIASAVGLFEGTLVLPARRRW